MSTPGYFGDIRDRFDELYATAASFVRLPSATACGGAHLRLNLDLSQDQAAHHFRLLCYAYEDSYDWSLLPLVFDPEVPQGVVRWQYGGSIVTELPIGSALAEFDKQCRSLLNSK